jgi:hypothetical protein
MSPVGPTPAPQAESEPKAGKNAGSGTRAKATSDGIAKAALERLGRALAGLVRPDKHRADLHGSGGSPQTPLPKNRSSFLSINLGKPVGYSRRYVASAGTQNENIFVQ